MCKIVVNEETTFEKQCPLAGVGLQECKPPALDERRRSRRKVKHLCVEVCFHWSFRKKIRKEYKERLTSEMKNPQSALWSDKLTLAGSELGSFL